MHQLKIFQIVATFWCFFETATTIVPNQSRIYDQLLKSLGVEENLNEIEDMKRSEVLHQLLTIDGCKSRHKNSVFVRTFDKFSNSTLNSQVKCFWELNNAINEKALSLSNLPNLEYLLIKLIPNLREVTNFSHPNIQYLKLNGETLALRSIRYIRKQGEKINLDNIDWNEDPSIISDKENSDNIFTLQLPNLKALTIEANIFHEGKFNFIINITSEKLTHLFLNHNNMIDINHHFINIKNLQEILFQNCQLKYYKSSPNLLAITHLSLYKNSISNHNNDSLNFQHHANLTFLMISKCLVHNFPKDTVKFNTKLHNLDLSYNEISALHSDTFQTNTKLEILNLNDNKFQQVPNLNIWSLKKLYMANNLLTELRDDSFSALENLQILILNGNKIHSVNSNTFVKLSNLQLIDITRNELNESLYQEPRNIKYLNKGLNYFGRGYDIMFGCNNRNVTYLKCIFF